MGRSTAEVAVASYTTFGLGGKAAAILVVKTGGELLETIKAARANKIPYRLIAGGSNVVCADGFFNGLVIVFRNPAGKVKIAGEVLECEASLLLAKLIASAIKNGLAGLESLSGIPGTVGGAVVGNAGACGQNISDHLVAVEVYDPSMKLGASAKKVRWLSKKSCQFAYRDSIFKHNPPAGGWLVLRAKFKLEKGDGKTLAKKSRELIKIRNKKYPPALRCPGSFFKNIVRADGSKIPAGKLLEEVGAKGMRVGGIYVADYHGNLLINNGKGTCSQVRQLAAKLKQKVFKKFGIKLEEEVRYMI